MKRKDQERFSFSKIDVFDKCGFRYKLHYVDGPQIFSKSIALDVGTLIHDAEEQIAKAIMAHEPIDYIKLKNNIIIKNYKLQHDYPEDYAEIDKAGRYYKDKIREYLTSGIYRLETFMNEHPELELVAAELPFNIMYSDYRFTGKIDRILRNKITGDYICQDIKTYPQEVEQKELATPLQFVVYTLAMKDAFKLTNEQISCAYDLPFCDVTQAAGTKGYMTRGLKKLDGLLADIDAGKFDPNPSPLCHWCPYCPTNKNQPKEAKNRCPYYSLWTKEHKVFTVAEKFEGLEKHQEVMEKYIAKQTNKTV